MPLKAKVSKTQQMKAKLANISKQNEDVDNHKKQLEEEVKRQKLLRNGVVSVGGITSVDDKSSKNTTSNECGADDISIHSVQSPMMNSGSRKAMNSQQSASGNNGVFTDTEGSNSNSTKSSSNLNLPGVLSTTKSQSELAQNSQAIRVSNWVLRDTFEDLNSNPPTVKSTDVYETIRFLGRGSFGDVNLVKSNDDNRKYADKTIYTEKEKYYIETLKEVKFLRTYGKHPYIMEIFDCYVISQPRVLHIIMPYCEAGDIDKIIKINKRNKTNISERDVLKWVLQISLALEYLHSNGVIHRDLKPLNVMLTEGGDIIKLCDFGLALVVSEAGDKDASAEAGTPHYTAPEMILGKRCSYSADCWSFGVMLYEIMTLCLPFHGNTTTALVKSILTEPPKQFFNSSDPTSTVINNPGYSYSDNLRSITYALLNKAPENRLSMTTLLTHPNMVNRISLIPQSYRPKALEERTRRNHVWQLNSQIDGLRSKTQAQAQDTTVVASTSEAVNTVNVDSIDTNNSSSGKVFRLGDVQAMEKLAALPVLILPDVNMNAAVSQATSSTKSIQNENVVGANGGYSNSNSNEKESNLQLIESIPVSVSVDKSKQQQDLYSQKTSEIRDNTDTADTADTTDTADTADTANAADTTDTADTATATDTDTAAVLQSHTPMRPNGEAPSTSDAHGRKQKGSGSISSSLDDTTTAPVTVTATNANVDVIANGNESIVPVPDSPITTPRNSFGKNITEALEYGRGLEPESSVGDN